MIKYSFIIPVYNTENYVEECIESIYLQDIPCDDFEVIAINDGSTDNSLGVLTKISQKHTNILIVNQANRGLSAARNVGINAAKGEYILFVDSDDKLIPMTLKHLLEITQSYKPDIIRGEHVSLNDDDILDFKQTKVINKPRHIKTDGRAGFLCYYDPNICCSWLNCYRRDFLLIHNLYFVEGMYFEDLAHTTKAYLLSKTFIKIELPFYIYRQRPTSITATIDVDKLKDMIKAASLTQKLSPLVAADEECRNVLNNAVFCTLNRVLWYIVHLRSLYKSRSILINEIRKEFPILNYNCTIRQKIICFMFNNFPNLYISLSHYLTIGSWIAIKSNM